MTLKPYYLIFLGPLCRFNCSFCYQRAYSKQYSRFNVKNSSDLRKLLKFSLRGLIDLKKNFEFEGAKILFEGGDVSFSFPINEVKKNISLLKDLSEFSESKSLYFLTRNVKYAKKLLSLDQISDIVRVQVSVGPDNVNEVLSSRILESDRLDISSVSFENNLSIFFEKIFSLKVKEPDRYRFRFSFRIPDTIDSEASLSEFENDLKKYQILRTELKDQLRNSCSFLREALERNFRVCFSFITVTKKGYLKHCTRSFISRTKPLNELEGSVLSLFREKHFENSFNLIEKTDLSQCLVCEEFLDQNCPGRCLGRPLSFCRSAKLIIKSKES